MAFSVSRSLRRGLIAGAAVLVLAGAAVGIASAQSTPTPTTTSQPAAKAQAFLDALAKRLNVSTSTLQQAISQARTDAGLPAGNTLPGFGHEGRGPGGPRGFGADLTTAAQAIGISADQLRQELPGKSLAQVAQAHGKNPIDVATALKNAAHQRIDQTVSAGRLTADQATQRKQQIDQRIDQMINQALPQGGPGGLRGPRPSPSATPGA